jgi:hypothetical protein
MVARASGCRLLGLVLSGVASTRDGSGAAVEALFGVTCACAEAASNSPFHGARVRGGCRHVRHLVAVGLGEGGERAGPPPLQVRAIGSCWVLNPSLSRARVHIWVCPQIRRPDTSSLLP